MKDRPEPLVPQIAFGFAPEERQTAALLFWSAFQDKLWRLLAPEARAVAFLADVLSPDHAISARAPDGRLLGLAGIKTDRGGLMGGGLRDLARVYGRAGALWRGSLLALLERRIEPGTLLMDGICVAEDARGMGVGTALLSAVKSHAVEIGVDAVRLDVVDTNQRARALYLREGFEPAGDEDLGVLRHVFGFRRSTPMIWHSPARGTGR